MDLTFASMSELSAAITNKEVSAKEVTRHFLGRIEKLNKTLNAFTFVDPNALKQAEAIDNRIAKGDEVGPLAGLPFGIKDMLCTQGMPSTAASKILMGFVPPYDATVVTKLKNAGAVILGKLNQDEFAMGSSSETSFYGVTKNPWDIERVPGGSSGGSAAAQASRMVLGAIGTDTGGSIRQPASFCGVVGIKPTYGRISRYGIIAYASSLDQAGPLANSVQDAALTLEVICGFDEKDSTSSQRVVPQFSKNLSQNIKGVRVGVLREFMNGSLDPDVEKTVNKSLEALKSLGAEVVEVSIPLTEYAVSCYYLIAASEASSNLSRYDGVKYGYRAEFPSLAHVDLETFYGKTRAEGFGAEVKRRIMLGTYCLSSGYFDEYYTKAGKVRRLLLNQYQEAFKSCDVILSPVTTHPAFKIGERISDPLAMYLNDAFTTATNLAGLPAMSLPFGVSSEGLPIGVQLQAAHFEEQVMLNVAFALEGASTTKGNLPDVI